MHAGFALEALGQLDTSEKEAERPSEHQAFFTEKPAHDDKRAKRLRFCIQRHDGAADICNPFNDELDFIRIGASRFTLKVITKLKGAFWRNGHKPISAAHRDEAIRGILDLNDEALIFHNGEKDRVFICISHAIADLLKC